MEIRTLNRKNTITLLNRKATIIVPKTDKENSQNDKQNQPPSEQIDFSLKMVIHSHQGSTYLRGTVPTLNDFKKFINFLYRGLYYSTNNLKGPSEEYLKKKKVILPEPKNDSKKKFLVLDLDETLIHSENSTGKSKPMKTDVNFEHDGEMFNFNVRPHCLEFLAEMSKHFHCYIFTAGTKDYAEPIVEYLNSKKKTIHGVLHRKNCMETNSGFFIKDLRIIQNRELKDIIMVDNLVHSFGLQLSNGIPILDFTDQKSDKELLGLQEFLISLAEVEDVRVKLQKKLKLHKILRYSESQYLKLDQTTKG